MGWTDPRADERPIVERVRIECTDCGGLIDADMAIRRNGKPYCGECQDHPIVERNVIAKIIHLNKDEDKTGNRPLLFEWD